MEINNTDVARNDRRTTAADAAEYEKCKTAKYESYFKIGESKLR